jgi:hypothetical protein
MTEKDVTGTNKGNKDQEIFVKKDRLWLLIPIIVILLANVLLVVALSYGWIKKQIYLPDYMAYVVKPATTMATTGIYLENEGYVIAPLEPFRDAIKAKETLEVYYVEKEKTRVDKRAKLIVMDDDAETIDEGKGLMLIELSIKPSKRKTTYKWGSVPAHEGVELYEFFINQNKLQSDKYPVKILDLGRNERQIDIDPELKVALMYGAVLYKTAEKKRSAVDEIKGMVTGIKDVEGNRCTITLVNKDEITRFLSKIKTGQ